MKPKLLLLMLGCSTFLVSCQTFTLSPKMRSYYQAEQNIKINALCQSLNLGDNLRSQLDSTSLQLNLPVARFNNLAQGRAVVILPVNDSSIRLFWVRQDSQGKWSIAEKQTVMQVQPGLLDASQMHRLHYNAQQQKVVLFITLPTTYWQQQITIQPVLEESESRWGRIQPFNTRLSAGGFLHPFRGIDRGLSGNTLPQGLTEIMNQIEPGSIYIPRIYADKITLLKPSLVNRNLCPLAGS
ncbi:MAG: hypothetical protein U7127_02985 [Phormidium sp.]